MRKLISVNSFNRKNIQQQVSSAFLHGDESLCIQNNCICVCTSLNVNNCNNTLYKTFNKYYKSTVYSTFLSPCILNKFYRINTTALVFHIIMFLSRFTFPLSFRQVFCNIYSFVRKYNAILSVSKHTQYMVIC